MDDFEFYSKDKKMMKSETFALRVVKCYDYLAKNNELVMSKQLLRSGTSIGANIAEGIYAESIDDFIHKLAIARKEASESAYWIRLLRQTDKLPLPLAQSMHSDCIELLKMLSASIKGLKRRSKTHTDPNS